jgi:hypothetical protein
MTRKQVRDVYPSDNQKSKTCVFSKKENYIFAIIDVTVILSSKREEKKDRVLGVIVGKFTCSDSKQSNLQTEHRMLEFAIRYRPLLYTEIRECIPEESMKHRILPTEVIQHE